MRRLVGLFAAALLTASLAPASAGPSAGGLSSDNLEYLKTVPLEFDSSGGTIFGDYFYITTSRGLTIYDISDPVNPVRAGQVLVPIDAPTLPEEDPETNGKILLMGKLGTLNVIDVEDKSNPTVIGTVDGADEHTISCVLDCKWAYGSEGVIVDLTDPTSPKIAGNWAEGTPSQGGGHDVTEVAPGLVVTSTNPIMLLDARKTPAKPKVLAMGTPGDDRFIHSNIWPRAMKDKFLLVSGESGGPGCDGDASSTFMTFDATTWKKNRSFKMIDEYYVENGLPTEGRNPESTWCTHWFETHPNFKNGGLVTIAWYEQGVRLLDISSKGKIEEVGYFLPFAGQTSATYWVNDEILYTADYTRGFDILRYTGN